MTECNHETFSFSNCRKRQVKGNFFGEPVSSNGGSLLVREVDRRMGLTIPAHFEHPLRRLQLARLRDQDDGWNDPRFRRDRLAPAHGAGCVPKGRNQISVSVELCNAYGAVTRETEMRICLNAQGTKAIMKNPHLVQQFLESSLRVYRPGRGRSGR